MDTTKRSIKVAENKADNATERKQRLQALRNSHKEKAGPLSNNKSGAIKKKGGRAAEGGDADNRKREFIKKLLQKRMQESGGESKFGQERDGQDKPFMRRALNKQAGKGKMTSGEGLDKFPRLKAMLEQQRGQPDEKSSVPVHELEARITKLENALKETQEKLDGARSDQEKKLEVVSGGSDEEVKG